MTRGVHVVPTYIMNHTSQHIDTQVFRTSARSSIGRLVRDFYNTLFFLIFFETQSNQLLSSRQVVYCWGSGALVRGCCKLRGLEDSPDV